MRHVCNGTDVVNGTTSVPKSIHHLVGGFRTSALITIVKKVWKKKLKLGLLVSFLEAGNPNWTDI